jgi:hypothetical protein
MAIARENRSFYLRFFGGILLILLPYIIGGVTAAMGVKTVPGWFGAAYVVFGLATMLVGGYFFFSSAEK